jgi:hypothetical protein
MAHPTLTEIGHARVTTGEGASFEFVPSLRNMAALGDPREIVRLFADVHSIKMAESVPAAIHVLWTCCDADCSALTGDAIECGPMPRTELLIMAQHLIKHGIVGTAKPTRKGSGGYSETFDASEFIDAAVIHFGMTHEEASGLTMTQFSRMLDMKFPAQKAAELPSAEQYNKRMAEFKAKQKKG